MGKLSELNINNNNNNNNNNKKILFNNKFMFKLWTKYTIKDAYLNFNIIK